MKLILNLFALLTIISCQNKSSENSFQLDFIQQTKEVIYLYKIVNNNPVKIDSSKTNSINHEFNIELSGADIFLVGTEPKKSILFIGLPNKSNEFLFKDGSYENLEVTGDSCNIILQNHFKYRNDIISKIQAINNSLDEEKIILKNNVIIKYQEYLKKFINENKQSPSLIMLLGEIQSPVEFQKELFIIKNIILNQFENQKYLSEINKAIENANQQQKFIKNEKSRLKKEKGQRKKMGISIGSEAPEIALENASGEIISLNSLRGKVVLLDFWASWCRPCRAENPNVVKLYNKYKNQKFTVFSVSFDQEKSKWLAAIKQDQLSWPNHVSELTGWKSTPGEKYGITSIPKTFLIDKNGVIIGYDLRGEALEKKISEIL
ncbi:TlpA family protein disulfide reductase [Flavobacteriales bacterium]|mgnify:FL=1|jgi:peroxiredoxin|nr:TlpA family protein disulfide reductase [Flavobacteriales bacterium]